MRGESGHITKVLARGRLRLRGQYVKPQGHQDTQKYVQKMSWTWIKTNYKLLIHRPAASPTATFHFILFNRFEDTPLTYNSKTSTILGDITYCVVNIRNVWEWTVSILLVVAATVQQLVITQTKATFHCQHFICIQVLYSDNNRLVWLSIIWFLMFLVESNLHNLTLYLYKADCFPA